MRHKFSLLKMAGVERAGIEAYRRLWALVSRAYPEPDDLSVYEVHENQVRPQPAMQQLISKAFFMRAVGQEGTKGGARRGGTQEGRRGGRGRLLTSERGRPGGGGQECAAA